MRNKAGRILLVVALILLNSVGVLFKMEYAPFADNVLISEAALEIAGALVILNRLKNGSNRTPVLLLVAALFSCLNYLFLGKLFSYDEERLREAWAHHETEYPRQWIIHLNDLRFVEFADRMTTFATTANFCFGYLDTEPGKLAKIPKNKQRAIMHNCILVNNLYLNSKLFQKQCISYEKSLFIQERYFSDSLLLSEADSLAIKAKLDSVANE